MARHNAALITGGVLILLGLGNWATGHSKVIEHQRLLVAKSADAQIGHYEEFSLLNAETNERLLRPLRARNDKRAAIVEKLDFYRVVERGGRLVCSMGLLIVLSASIVGWYRHRATSPSGTRSEPATH